MGGFRLTLFFVQGSDEGNEDRRRALYISDLFEVCGGQPLKKIGVVLLLVSLGNAQPTRAEDEDRRDSGRRSSSPCPSKYDPGPLKSGPKSWSTDFVKITVDKDQQYREKVDFGPYMSGLLKRCKKTWFPPRGEEWRRATLTFKVHSDGKVSNIAIIKGTGLATSDQAAIHSIELASPLRALPAGASDGVKVEVTLDHNAFFCAAADSVGAKETEAGSTKVDKK